MTEPTISPAAAVNPEGPTITAVEFAQQWAENSLDPDINTLEDLVTAYGNSRVVTACECDLAECRGWQLVRPAEPGTAEYDRVLEYTLAGLFAEQLAAQTYADGIADAVSENRFADITDIETLIGTAIGAATNPNLWLSDAGQPATRDTLGNECIFDGFAANAIVTDTLQRLSQLLGETLT